MQYITVSIVRITPDQTPIGISQWRMMSHEYIVAFPSYQPLTASGSLTLIHLGMWGSMICSHRFSGVANRKG